MVPMTLTTKTFVSVIILSSSLFSLHHANTFFAQYYGNLYDSAASYYSEELQQSTTATARNPDTPIGTNASESRLSIATASNISSSSSSSSSSISRNNTYTIPPASISYDTEKRAIVIISTGEKAANMSMVERFIWSARNIGEYKGWIVLITDADKYRYEDLAVAALPQGEQDKPKYENGTIADSFNSENKFLVFRPTERRFAKITRHRRFTQATDMNSKIFKTYALQYADEDARLDSIELFYYLDVDIVFGNRVQPFFEGLERLYKIGRITDGREEASDNSDRRYNVNDSTAATDRENGPAKIYFFEGNGRNRIQGGQIVLDRESSQPCLERWRELMQERRKRRKLKDQMSLTTMLKEQKARAKAKRTNVTDSDVATHNITDEVVDEKKELKGSRPDCEITLMKQKREWIQFPELDDIQKRNAEMQEKDAKRPEYPTLVHFRNSANVMKKVEEEHLQIYMRDVLGFDQDEKDELGILNKMIMENVKR
eukprot:jgi/Psemu1/50400/gm1.50400_g